MAQRLRIKVKSVLFQFWCAFHSMFMHKVHVFTLKWTPKPCNKEMLGEYDSISIICHHRDTPVRFTCHFLNWRSFPFNPVCVERSHNSRDYTADFNTPSHRINLPESINSLLRLTHDSLLLRRLSSMALMSAKGQLQSGNFAEQRHQQSLLRHSSSPSELHAT